MKALEYFDKIYWINLDSRTDRRERMEAFLDKWQIKAERFPAIELSKEQNEQLKKDGCYFRNDERPEHARFTKSCALSHLSIVLRAKLLDFNNVLIFEDDVDFKDDIEEKLEKAVKDLKQQEYWNMFYLGCNPFEFTKLTDNLSQSFGASTAHAYAINKNFYNTILDMSFKWMPCIDIYYHTISKEHKVFMTNENLAFQMPGYSTLEEREVDYNPSIEARYYRQSKNK